MKCDVEKAHAIVDFKIDNNSTWEDAMKFGNDGDTTWSFVGQSFRMDIKNNKDDATVLLSLTSGAGTIVVDDPVVRVLHLFVDDATLRAALLPGRYVYDLVMIDTSIPPVRVVLMGGKVEVRQGVTGD